MVANEGAFYNAHGSTKYHRRSIRLKGYDYSKAGAYFVTVCVHDRRSIFGKILNEQVLLTKYGQIAENCLFKIPEQFQNVELDKFTVMPNHIHGILFLNVGARFIVPNKAGFDKSNPYITNNPMLLNQITLGKIIRFYKAKTSYYIKNTTKFYRFKWQRNYYEHIIRSEDELTHFREYIANNPLQWQFDRENPKRVQDRDYYNQWGYIEEIIYGRKKQ